MRRAWLALAAALLAGCRQPQAMVMPDSGREIYLAQCAVCHNTRAEGIPGMYPPLAGTEWTSGPPERLGAVIMDGMNGPSGKYNGVMPGWRAVLNDAQIAALITLLRQGDGKPPVTPVEVARLRRDTEQRRTFWTLDALRSVPIH
jgi:mono/diheme cytochrome c family protein